MTPREAIKLKDICTLRTDNYDTKAAWIIIDNYDVTLCTQRNGEDSTGKVTLSRRDFNALIDWYNREQKVRKKP